MQRDRRGVGWRAPVRQLAHDRERQPDRRRSWRVARQRFLVDLLGNRSKVCSCNGDKTTHSQGGLSIIIPPMAQPQRQLAPCKTLAKTEASFFGTRHPSASRDRTLDAFTPEIWGADVCCTALRCALIATPTLAWRGAQGWIEGLPTTPLTATREPPPLKSPEPSLLWH